MANDGQIVRRPAVPPPVRIRKDVGNMDANDPVLKFYRDAIGVMKTRPLSNPTSWRYQAAIHGYPTLVSSTNARRGTVAPGPGPDGADPFAVDADNPLPGDRDTFWRKCAHAGWFFLPWHRIYLHFFEKTIMKIVIEQLSGPRDWALPYWNYSKSDAAALLPVPFRDAQFNGATNHLFVAERTPNANIGQPFLDRTATGGPDPAKPDTNVNCLRISPFANRFGGAIRLQHDPGPGGAVESAPQAFAVVQIALDDFGAERGKRRGLFGASVAGKAADRVDAACQQVAGDAATLSARSAGDENDRLIAGGGVDGHCRDSFQDSRFQVQRVSNSMPWRAAASAIKAICSGVGWAAGSARSASVCAGPLTERKKVSIFAPGVIRTSMRAVRSDRFWKACIEPRGLWNSVPGVATVVEPSGRVNVISPSRM